MQILRHLHFSDNQNHPAVTTEHLCKVQPVSDMTLAAIQRVYKPNQNSPLNKAMVP
jgi:hypothetical protein